MLGHSQQATVCPPKYKKRPFVLRGRFSYSGTTVPPFYFFRYYFLKLPNPAIHQSLWRIKN